MKKIFFLIFFPFFIFAQVSTVSVEAVGFGNSYSEAVKNALINALAQAKGIKVDAKKVYQKNLSQVAISVNGSSNRLVKINDSVYSQVASATHGFIKKFKILNVSKLSEYEYKADVLAYFSYYQTPGLNPRKRRSLAVFPLKHKSYYFINGIRVDGEKISKIITQALVTKLTQTRKFTILDRENSNYYEAEKNFLLSPNTDPVELSRLGKRLGADYVIIGNIIDFGVKKYVEHEEYTGENYVNFRGYATISYRILAIATQQIKWSDTLNINVNISGNNRLAVILTNMADKIAQKITNEIVFNIYPPRIILVEGKKAVVNMGGNFIHLGEIFNVFALGKPLYDPYTHEFLGRDETFIGKVKVIRVLPKISYVILLSGNLQKGAVLRKIKNTIKKQTPKNVGRDSYFDAIFHK